MKEKFPVIIKFRNFASRLNDYKFVYKNPIFQ